MRKTLFLKIVKNATVALVMVLFVVAIVTVRCAIWM